MNTLLLAVTASVLVGGLGGCSSTTSEGASSGALVAKATVDSTGAVLMVGSDSPIYDGATLEFAAGAVVGPLVVEVHEVQELDGVPLLAPFLSVTADGPLPRTGLAVKVPGRAHVDGVEFDDQALFGLGFGAVSWVELARGAQKADSIATLVASMEALTTQAEIDQGAGNVLIGGEHPDVASAVMAGATGVARLGVPTPWSPDHDQLLLLSADAQGEVAAGLAPHRLTAPAGTSLRDFICEAGQHVLFLHGITSSSSNFTGPQDVLVGLAALGWTVGRFDYPSLQAIDSNGALLADWLGQAQQACSSLPAPALSGVGHSMGGLVLRSALQLHGAPLDRVVMLSTPNSGGDSGAIASGLGKGVGWVMGSRGLSDLVAPSDVLTALADPASLQQFRDQLYVVMGWGSYDGWLSNVALQASDGLVSLESALSLDLPYGQEVYISRDQATGKFVARPHVNSDGFESDVWQGVPDEGLDHFGIHEHAANNGALAAVEGFLSTAADEPTAGRRDRQPTARPSGACLASEQVDAAGYLRTCSVSAEGMVYCWGTYSDRDEDGEPLAIEQPVPVEVAPGLSALSVAVARAGWRVCAVTPGHDLWCWGDGRWGPWSNGVELYDEPTETLGTGDIAAVSMAYSLPGCILRTDGVAGCRLDVDGPLEPHPTRADVTQVCSANQFGCVLEASGQVACVGNNQDGGLGLGHTDWAELHQFHDVPGLPAVEFIACGPRSACASTVAGELFCWGANHDGWLSTEDQADEVVSPSKVAGISNAIQVSIADDHLCAVTVGGSLSCWGRNYYGTLGYPDEEWLQPRVVPGLKDVRSVSTGKTHTCAVTEAGDLHCWGWWGGGQLGHELQHDDPASTVCLPAPALDE